MINETKTNTEQETRGSDYLYRVVVVGVNTRRYSSGYGSNNTVLQVVDELVSVLTPIFLLLLFNNGHY
jgi:hypothetical protein